MENICSSQRPVLIVTLSLSMQLEMAGEVMVDLPPGSLENGEGKSKVEDDRISMEVFKTCADKGILLLACSLCPHPSLLTPLASEFP